MNINSFEDLEIYLENWVNFHGSNDVSYDFNGALNLLSAILRNMNKYGIKSDFEGIEDFFEKEELDILKLLLNHSWSPE